MRAFAGAAAPAAAPQQGATFAILEYRVLGNSVLPARTIERAVYPHLGPARSIADAQAARVDLEKAYRDAGYSTIYVDIPEQSVENGVVRLQVTEGRLERVRVTGTRYFSNRRILAAAPALETGAVPYFPAVQQQLAELNRESADLKVAPVLRPGTVPGTVDVDLKANDTLPMHAAVEVNNDYTVGTPHTRMVFNLAYTNLFQSSQSLALQYQVAPQQPKDSSVLSATYGVPLGSHGASLTLLGLLSNSNVAAVGTLGVVGKGQIYGAHFSTPLSSSADFYPSFTFGGDFKDFDSNVLLSGATGLETPIRYINWSVIYGGAFVRSRMAASFDVGLNFGIRGLVNQPADFENNRYLAQPNYMYLRANGSADHALVWGSRLALRVSGQYTTEPLVSYEQFAIGGVNSVRGYLEAEALGDTGASGSIELRSPSPASLFGVPVQSAYVLAFSDAGIVSIISPLPQQLSRIHLASAGVGMRVAGFSGFNAVFDWAYPLVSTSEVKAGESRVDFQFRYGF